jgi:hypothetical protein
MVIVVGGIGCAALVWRDLLFGQAHKIITASHQVKLGKEEPKRSRYGGDGEFA